jgi:hypothetical protein
MICKELVVAQFDFLPRRILWETTSPSVRMAIVPTVFRTGYLPHTSQKPYRLNQLAGFEVGTVRHDPSLEYALTRSHE